MRVLLPFQVRQTEEAVIVVGMLAVAWWAGLIFLVAHVIKVRRHKRWYRKDRWG